MKGAIMSFDEFKNNKALSESALTFTPWRPIRLNMTRKVHFGPPDPLSGYPVNTAGEITENGDLILRFYAPEGKEMYATIGGYNRMGRIEMEKREDGVFEGTFPYDPRFAGFRRIHFYLDGTDVINTKMMVSAGGHTFANYVELPDPEVPYILLKDVPHGSLSRELYYSRAMNEWMRCMVYLPPGYHEGGEYPVLYLQDGALGSELTWMLCTKVPYIMDNMIAAGECEPYIVVTNDPQLQYPQDMEAVDNFDAFVDTLVGDCVPFIDSRFRTKADKWHRAMAGFSLGSMETSCTGLRHPETFGWLGILSGYMRRRDSHPRYEQNPYLDQLSREFLEKNYLLFFRCMGDLDGNFPEFLEDDEFCIKKGADQAACYQRKVYPDCIHDINTERREYYDLAKMLFKKEHENE